MTPFSVQQITPCVSPNSPQLLLPKGKARALGEWAKPFPY